MKKPQVVIIGGGFGGLTVVQSLRRANVELVLIDRRNHHLFQPLLYQVATASLSPADIASPLRSVFRSSPSVRVILATAEKVSLDRRTVTLDEGEISYDALILAAGASHSYFGHEDW